MDQVHYRGGYIFLNFCAISVYIAVNHRDFLVTLNEAVAHKSEIMSICVKKVSVLAFPNNTAITGPFSTSLP